MLILAFTFGVLLVLPIGAADMPVVIALLNSYAGLAAAATGMVIGNNVLIIAGTLDGGSGFILSIVMCKAMNRSITNVLFGAFGSVSETTQASEGQMREIGLDDVAVQLAYARQGFNDGLVFGHFAVENAQRVGGCAALAVDAHGRRHRFQRFA